MDRYKILKNPDAKQIYAPVEVSDCILLLPKTQRVNNFPLFEISSSPPTIPLEEIRERSFNLIERMHQYSQDYTGYTVLDNGSI